AVVGGRNRTNILARSIITMLAKHRLEYNRFQVIRILFIAYKIAVDTQPVHIMVTQYFSFTYYRYIVFSMTSYHAGITTIAAVHINAHRPSYLVFAGIGIRI